MLDETITDSEEEARKNIVLLKIFREVDRLAYVVRAIEIECAAVPVGSFKLHPSHELHYD